MRALLSICAVSSLAVGCGQGEAVASAPNALLITLDTTRPEALGAHGDHPGLTPALDALAAEGVLYTRARTVAPLTLPSHASILTGLYPPRHTVRANSAMVLPDEARTFAELAQDRGYETAAFVAAVVLDRRFGLDQGFEVYGQPVEPDVLLDRTYESRPAGEVVDEALQWLRGRDGSRPFFAWLHVFDPHAPYEPPAEFTARAGGDAYLGEVAWMDAELGRFLRALGDGGLLEDTVVVVVADHGEALGEHGEQTHGFFCFDSTIRVPLIVRVPDDPRAGTKSDEVVSVVDVFPTLTEALGFGLTSDLDGHSLLSAVPADRGVYFEALFGYMALGWSPLAGWATGEAKYLHSSTPALFDLEADPGETRDLSAQRREDVARFAAEIGRVADRPSLSSGSLSGASGELMRRLEGLGYTGAGVMLEQFPHPLAESQRVSPLERVEAYAMLQRAQDLSFAGQAEAALPLLEEILAGNADNAAARFQLGGALVQLERYEEALGQLRENLRLRGSWRGVHIQQGICLENLGQAQEAVREYGLALEHDPGLAAIELDLIRLLEELGRSDEANLRRLQRLEREPR